MPDWQLMSAGCPHFQARVVYCVNSRDLPTVSEMSGNRSKNLLAGLEPGCRTGLRPVLSTLLSGNVDSAPKFLCQELI